MADEVESMESRIRQLRELKELSYFGGGKEKVERIHQRGKLWGRERLDRILDPGSFVEVSQLFGYKAGLPGQGIICGHGTIDGRVVCIFAHDATVLGGSTGGQQGLKMYKVYERALGMRVPAVALFDSPGGQVVRLDRPIDVIPDKSLDSIWYPIVQASGIVPQISALLGACAGGSVYYSALMDFVFMVDGISQAFVSGSVVTKTAVGEDVTNEELGGARIHSEISGYCDFRCSTEDECFRLIRRLISFLPNNCDEKAPHVDTGDDPNRLMLEVEEIVSPDPLVPYDMHKVINLLVDNGDFLEVKKEFAREIIVGFGRLNGEVVGIVANNPMHFAGAMTCDSSDKQARFMRFCDCFNIPIILLADAPGYIPGTASERAGIIRHGAKVLWAHCECTAPKISVLVRKCYGGAQNGMGVAVGMGTDYVFAWVTAEVGALGDKQTVEILYRRELEQAEDPEKLRAELVQMYHDRYAAPFEAASIGNFQFEDIIEPKETRRRICQALQLLKTKKVLKIPKKHGNIPL